MLLKTLNPQKKLKGILGSDKKIVGKIVVEKTPKKWLFFIHIVHKNCVKTSKCVKNQKSWTKITKVLIFEMRSFENGTFLPITASVYVDPQRKLFAIVDVISSYTSEYTMINTWYNQTRIHYD